MANPTAGVPVTTTPFADEKTIVPLAATAQTLYPGEAIGRNTSGDGTKCDATAALKFAGVVADANRITVDAADSAGDKSATCQLPRYLSVAIRETATAGDEGKPVWWQFSNQVSYFARDNNAEFANFAGYVHRVVSSSVVEIAISTDGPTLEVITLAYSSPANSFLFVAERPLRIVDVRGKPLTVAAFTADIKKVPDNTAIASGTTLLAAATSFDFNGTTLINQVLNLTTNTTVADLAAGDAIALNVNATATNATGVLTITVAPRAR